jgi:predicted nucleic acid-binding protein
VSAGPEVLTAVLDANGIIGLAKAGCLGLTPDLFSRVVVPTAVIQKVTDPISARELAAALANWLSETNPAPTSLEHCQELATAADLAVLALAWEQQPAVLVTGDLKLARKAQSLGIETVSGPTLILLLVDAGLLQSAKPYFDRMMERGFGIGSDTYRAILEQLGEI